MNMIDNLADQILVLKQEQNKLNNLNYSLKHTNANLNKTINENEKEIIRLINIISRLECNLRNNAFEINKLKDIIVKQTEKHLEDEY